MPKKLAAAAGVAALLLILVPGPSHAAPGRWASLSEPAAGLLATIERWWTLLLNGPERPGRTEPSADWRKNGCGMDPNGQPLPCPGPSPTATPEPTKTGAH